MATVFRVSADFPIDKPMGAPCPNLLGDFSCVVHDRLQPLGFRGCAVFDCFGAGQHLTQRTMPGHDWRDAEQAPTVFAAFAVLRQLHELLWHVRQAAALAGSHVEIGDLAPRVTAAARYLEELRALEVDALIAVDPGERQREIGALLSNVSRRVRASDGGAGSDLQGADLMGRDLRRADLSRASLRGAYLIAADLRAAVLDRTDLLGADLRDADLRGTDLSGALFVTQMQVNAARGDATSALPPDVSRPAHWTQ